MGPCLCLRYFQQSNIRRALLSFPLLLGAVSNNQQTTNYKLQTLRRWIFGAGTIFILYRIFITQIRGAIIGLLAGLFILGVGLLFGRALNKKTRIAVGITGGLILLALSVFIIFRNSPVFQELSPIKKITGISLSEA